MTHRVLVGRPDRKRLLGKPRLRWDDDITIKILTGLPWLRIGRRGGRF
jgi:hypothetical protein